MLTLLAVFETSQVWCTAEWNIAILNQSFDPNLLANIKISAKWMLIYP